MQRHILSQLHCNKATIVSLKPLQAHLQHRKADLTAKGSLLCQAKQALRKCRCSVQRNSSRVAGTDHDKKSWMPGCGPSDKIMNMELSTQFHWMVALQTSASNLIQELSRS